MYNRYFLTFSLSLSDFVHQRKMTRKSHARRVLTPLCTDMKVGHTLPLLPGTGSDISSSASVVQGSPHGGLSQQTLCHVTLGKAQVWMIKWRGPGDAGTLLHSHGWLGHLKWTAPSFISSLKSVACLLWKKSFAFKYFHSYLMDRDNLWSSTISRAQGQFRFQEVWQLVFVLEIRN